MSVFDEEENMVKMDETCMMRVSKLRATWKTYSIYLFPADTVRVFSNDNQYGVQELNVTPELLKGLYQDVGLEFDTEAAVTDSVRNLISHINATAMLKLIRTVHPVGQGAFYSERFVKGDCSTSFLAVYDCGSKKPRKLDWEISSSFSKGDAIDLLFISHLDNDHVSGICKLKETVKSIKTVVLPLIPQSQKLIYLLFADKTLSDIILRPEVFFNGSRIIYVKPVADSDEIDPVQLPFEGDVVREIESGTKIQLSESCDWCYIPYNYDEDTRAEEFKKKLSEKGWEVSNLSEEEFIAKHREELNEIYKKVCGNSVNDSSLVVYSGGLNREFPSRYACKTLKRSKQSGEACLYLGDVGLNQPVRNATPIIYDLMSRLIGCNVCRHIGTIQLPHHGSKENFHSGLLAYGLCPKVYFASHGNMYGHPSTMVAGMIEANNEVFHEVTDLKDSTFRQIVYLPIA